MWLDIKRNWKTNLVSLVAFIYSVPQAVQVIQAWSTGQSTNWRPAVVGLIVAAGMAAAKDSTNHSTQAEVVHATVDKQIDDLQKDTAVIKWNNVK